jgi:SOS-response transcriptional repressor LexA
MKHDTKSEIPKEVITYTAGAVEGRIAEIARNTNQPESELREWVAIFLLSSWTGISDYMPTLRGKATKVYKTTRKMAVAVNSHRKPQTHSNKKGYKYPIGTHWTQRPENKAKLIKLTKARYMKQGHKVA